MEFILSMLAMVRVFFLSRSDAALEVLALRQQLAVLKRKRPRPALNRLDRLFWSTLRHFWSRWKDVLVIVKPETVISWHRAGFRLYWRAAPTAKASPVAPPPWPLRPPRFFEPFLVATVSTCVFLTNVGDQ